MFKRTFLLLAVVCLSVLSMRAQTQTAQQTQVFVTTASSGALGLAATGTAFNTLQWWGLGTLSTCTIKVEQSASGVGGWSDLIAAQNCTANGQATSPGVPNFVRITVTALSGGGNVTAKYTGMNSGPTVLGYSGYTTVDNAGTPLTARSIINFDGTGVACVDNAGASRTDCTGTGGGGGGGTPCTTTALSLQFNNAGAFGCISTATFSATPKLIAVSFAGRTNNPLMLIGEPVGNLSATGQADLSGVGGPVVVQGLNVGGESNATVRVLGEDNTTTDGVAVQYTTLSLTGSAPARGSISSPYYSKQFLSGATGANQIVGFYNEGMSTGAVSAASGTVTDYMGFRTESLFKGGMFSGTLTNQKGLSCAAMAGATNNYCLYVDDQGTGTNDYSIYSAGGKNHFVGPIRFGGTTNYFTFSGSPTSQRTIGVPDSNTSVPPVGSHNGQIPIWDNSLLQYAPGDPVISYSTPAESTAAWTSATGGNTAVTVNLYDSTLANSFSTVVVTLKQGSTISGGVVTFEVSDTTAFTNAYNALCWQMTGAVTTSTYTLTATTNVSFQCNVASFAAFRIRLSTVITGSATVNVGVQPSAAPSQPYTIVTPANGSTTTVSGTVTANAGSNLNTSLLALESGGNLATLAGGVAASVYQANVKQVNGVTTLAGAGATGTGSQRETVAQDTTTIAGSAPGTAGSASTNVVTVQGIASMTKLLVTPDSVALPSNQSVNVSQINGITPLMGNGVTGTGSQRVTIASDNTAFSVNATLSAETTKAIGVVRNADGAGNLLLSAANALNSTGTGVLATQAVGQFDDVAPTAITENQFGNLRMSANRNLYNTIRDAAGNERGANVNSSNQLSVSCDNGCAGGTFNNNADAVATSATNGQSAAWLYGFNGTTYDRLRVDGSKNLEVNCATCGTTDNTAYTLGTGSINVTGGVSQSGTPTAVSAGQAVSFVTDLNRRLEITCPDGTCSAAGGSLQIKDGANTSTNVGYYPGNLNMPVQEVNSTNILSAVNKLTSTFAPRSVYGVNPGLVPVQAVNAFVTNLPGIDLSTVSKVPLTGQVAGSLPVTIVAGAGSGGTASNFAAAFPAAGTAIGVKSGANMVNLTADGSNNLNVNCTVGCSGGATTPADAFANPTTAGVQFDFLAGYNGTTWDRLRVDGSKNLLVGVNAALPAGSNVIGHVITDTGSTTAVTGTVTTTDNITQFGGVNLSTGTGASGTGIPRVTVANDSNILATESGTWSIRNQDGAGNALTSNSTTYTAKFGLDANLLGTLGTAFSTAGKIDVKGADGDVFVRSNAASTFPVNIGTWIGSAAPTVGSKTSANSIPVVVASDQGSIPVTLTSTTVTGTVAVTQSTSPWVDAGNKTNNNAAPGATNIGTLPGVATAVAPTYVEGNQVSLSTDLTGALRVSGSAGGGVAQTQVRDALNNWTDVGYKSGNLNMPVQEANSSALVASINALISTVKTDRLLGTLGQPISSTGSALDVAVKYTNPCNDPSQLRSAPISQTANTRLIVAEAKIMICGVFVIGADAENVSIVSGTGATCGTGTAAVIGGSTAANGPNMAANGGWTMSFSVPAPAVDLCLFQSGSGRVAGVLTYAFMR